MAVGQGENPWGPQVLVHLSFLPIGFFGTLLFILLGPTGSIQVSVGQLMFFNRFLKNDLRYLFEDACQPKVVYVKSFFQTCIRYNINDFCSSYDRSVSVLCVFFLFKYFKDTLR